MEYAQDICSETCDNNYMKHVGYKETNECMKDYFSKKNVDKMSLKITELLMGVDPLNRPIIVPHKTICSVMSNIYDNFRPETGDIWTRYNIPKNTTNDIANMTNQVIEVITSDVRTSLGMEEHNSKLTKWTTILGDFNPHGLRSYPPIKIRHKRPNPMEFHLNY